MKIKALLLCLLLGCAQAQAGSLTLTGVGKAAAGGSSLITHVSSVTGNAMATSITINGPPWTSNNYVVLEVQYDTAGSDGNITLPSGCAYIDNGAGTWTGGTIGCTWASPPASLTFTPVSDTALDWTVNAEEYSGVNLTTPVNVHSLKFGASTKSITATAVTTTVTNTVIVYFGDLAIDTNVATAVSTPSTFTLRSTILDTGTDSGGTGLGGVAWDKAQAATGSVASQTSTITTAATAANTFNFGAYVALRQ